MRDEIHVTRGQNDAGEKLNVSGGLDIARAPALERKIAHAADGNGRRLRLDISGMTFIDATGPQAILHVHNAIEACGGRVAFEKPQHEVRAVLHLLGLDQVLDITP
jgi:anti-sigma B factor antagonist